MRMLPGRIGTIRKELDGKVCPSCSWKRYQIVLRCGVEFQKGGLFAQCSRCHAPRDLEEDDWGQGDTMATILFRYSQRPSDADQPGRRSAPLPHEQNSKVGTRSSTPEPKRASTPPER